MVVVSRNPIYSVLFLVLVFCNVAGLVILLGAEFLAFVFIVVYVGAIAVLFLFVVMMINFKMVEVSGTLMSYLPLSAYIIGIIAIELYLILSSEVFLGTAFVSYTYVDWVDVFFAKSNIESLGLVLYTHYVLLFFLSAVILLVAMIGSIVLTLLNRTNMKRQDIYEQVVRSAVLVRKFK
jgi:NADH-quinone oxidoreductase subunit J